MNFFDTLNMLGDLDDGTVLLEEGVYQFVPTSVEVKPSKNNSNNLVAHITGDLLWENDSGEYVPLPHKHWMVINGEYVMGLSNAARWHHFLYELDAEVTDNEGVVEIPKGASILAYVHQKTQSFESDDGETVEYVANQIKYFLNSRGLEEVTNEEPLIVTSVFSKPSARNNNNTVYTFWLVGSTVSGRKVSVTHTVTVSADKGAKSNKAAKVFFAMLENPDGYSSLERVVEDVKDLVGYTIVNPNVDIKETTFANNYGQNTQRYALELDWSVI